MRQYNYSILQNIFVSMCFVFISLKLNAQQNVSISDVSATPDASSVLDVNSTTKGLLIPRVALTATNSATPITLPAKSLLVYNTATAGVSPNNVIEGYYYNAGTPAAPNWLRVYAGSAAGTEWKLLGNAGTDANINFLGTIDAVDLVFRTNNLQRARINSIGNMGVGVAPMGAAGQAILSVSRDGVNACCGGENSTLALGEATTTSGRRPSISFHASGESEGVMHITQTATGVGVIGANRRIRFFDNQSQGLGIEMTGNLWFGNGNSRTQTRGNAGLRGDAGAQSGFYEFNQTTGNSQDYNYPTGYAGNTWWHLLDIRHSNSANNYAMQFSGNFFDQNLFFRKTNDNAAQPWTRVLTSNDATKVTSVYVSNNIQLNGNNTGTYANGTGRGWTIGTWQDLVGLTVTSTVPVGKKVVVQTSLNGYANDWSFFAPGSAMFRIVRDNTVQVGKTEVLTNESDWFYYYFNANFSSVEFTGDGASHSWKIQYWLTNTTGSTESIFVEDRSIIILEATQP